MSTLPDAGGGKVAPGAVVGGWRAVARQSRSVASGAARSLATYGTNGRHIASPLLLLLLGLLLRATAGPAAGAARARAAARTAARWQWRARYVMWPGQPPPAATNAAGSDTQVGTQGWRGRGEKRLKAVW
jgi:hypothetical protein